MPRRIVYEKVLHGPMRPAPPPHIRSSAAPRPAPRSRGARPAMAPVGERLAAAVARAIEGHDCTRRAPQVRPWRATAADKASSARTRVELHELASSQPVRAKGHPFPPRTLAPRMRDDPPLAGGASARTIASEVRHDRRTIVKLLDGVGRPHGGVRKDVLGDDDRRLLQLLVRRFPQALDSWFARVLSKCLGRAVSSGVVARGCERLRLPRKEVRTLYSE